MSIRFGLMAMGMALVLAGAYGGDEKETAFEVAKGLMDQGEWKKAVKALKSYKKKHAETEEEKGEVEALILRAEGEKDFAEISKKYQKSHKVRTAVKSIQKFMREFKDDPELMTRAEEFHEGLRAQYVMVITSFEEGDWPSDDSGMTPVDDVSLIRHGSQAARWVTGLGDCWAEITPAESNWTKYDYFCLWIYSETKPTRPGYFFIRPGIQGSTWEHHFEYNVCVDFKGWREIRLPLRGKGGQFGKSGMVSWANIESVRLYHSDWTGVSVDVILDDMRLEKAVK